MSTERSLSINWLVLGSLWTAFMGVSLARAEIVCITVGNVTLTTDGSGTLWVVSSETELADEEFRLGFEMVMEGQIQLEDPEANPPTETIPPEDILMVQVFYRPQGASEFLPIIIAQPPPEGNIVNMDTLAREYVQIIEIWGGPGNDVIDATACGGDNAIPTTLYGEDGSDTIHGGDASDQIFGGAGDDSLLEGGSGNDTIHGGEGNDVIDGGPGHDSIYGGDGNDVISGSRGKDLLDGGDGWDVLDCYSGGPLGVQVNMSILPGEFTDDWGDTDSLGTSTSSTFSAVRGSPFPDTLLGNLYESTTILGGNGNDWIAGGSASDVLFGEGGDDTIMGGAGKDVVIGGPGVDLIDAGGEGDIVCAYGEIAPQWPPLGTDPVAPPPEPSSTSCPFRIPGDYDIDNDVDEDDLILFLSCATGPAIPTPSPWCDVNADFDFDHDIDQDDFAVVQRCFSAQVPADPLCSTGTGGFVTTVTGLRYKDEVIGTGDLVTPSSTVTVLYTGRFNDKDGAMLASFTDPNNPAVFGISFLIQGWREGLGQHEMHVGGTRQLIVPPELAYGEYGLPPDIPPDATLWFRVQVLDAE